MKKGLAYASSREKRNFDIAVSSVLLPGKRGAEFIVERFLAKSADPELKPIIEQERMGWVHRPFHIQKFQTLNPDTGEPLGPWAERFRRLGLDELAQVENIKAGDMSFTGPRPLIVSEYEAVRDSLPPALGRRWDFIIGASRPGLYSSYGIYSHTREAQDPNEPEIRAEMDIQDAVDASVVHDIALTTRFITVALARRLQ